ncbi:MAG TPA: TrbG/VirB9 family P-type conjugative transfer protein, partial [Sphingomonas sp.]
MKRLLPLAALLASSALAKDPRIATRLYNAGEIVAISGRPDIQSTIEFGDDERIENIAVGDSATWQVTPNKRASLLFVKPMKAPARTNMTVVTDQRTY